MKKGLLLTVGTAVGLAALALIMQMGTGEGLAQDHSERRSRPVIYNQGFNVEVLVNGRPLETYHARGKTYIEALHGAEYEVSIRNPLPYRVAVALSVDGMNSIDARRTTAWNASKWVIGPYETIRVGGWQMSSNRARRFYFTTEKDSYGAKIGQTANFGVISAVFFRERQPKPVTITPAPRREYEGDSTRDRSGAAPSARNESQGGAKTKRDSMTVIPDDDYAATGIGRSVHNDVRWVSMDLESRAAAEVTIRYEYYPALVRLGIIPRRYYPSRDPIQRREGSSGFEDRRFSPEP
jgi:hypothetical protein